MTAENAKQIDQLFKKAFDLDEENPHFSSMVEKSQPTISTPRGGMTPPPAPIK